MRDGTLRTPGGLRKRLRFAVAALLAGAALAGGATLAGCGNRSSDPHLVRVGHFPNVTHAHGLIGHARTRRGKPWFEPRLGEGMRVEWYTYNAGPSAIEAIVAGTLDLTYVGPNPALNMHMVSKGTEIRVISGATRGGSALVVQGDGRIASPADLRGRSVGTPQFGNTQDVACRAWLRAQGFRIELTGGDVTVVPTPNPEQLTLFSKGDFAAVWTVEPWVSRLEAQAKGRVMVEERDAITTVLVASARLLAERPEVARRFAAAHAEMTAWLRDHPDEAREEARAELLDETRIEFPDEIAARAWARLTFDDRIAREEFDALVRSAQGVGFLQDAISLDRLVVKP